MLTVPVPRRAWLLSRVRWQLASSYSAAGVHVVELAASLNTWIENLTARSRSLAELDRTVSAP
ncbi:hypothetical protein [Streptomyces sp. B6B3]|uniref:hypothetical protein n=1 Tax=Streptomyces sp. B6B3 TaxID=3153570 RepID=UPI00325FC24D